MTKFIIREEMPYEGFYQWTVFAESDKNAFDMIKAANEWHGECLQILSRRPVTGSKIEFIHKRTKKFHQ
jgi:hypothetical protein